MNLERPNFAEAPIPIGVSESIEFAVLEALSASETVATWDERVSDTLGTDINVALQEIYRKCEGRWKSTRAISEPKVSKDMPERHVVVFGNDLENVIYDFTHIVNNAKLKEVANGKVIAKNSFKKALSVLQESGIPTSEINRLRALGRMPNHALGKEQGPSKSTSGRNGGSSEYTPR